MRSIRPRTGLFMLALSNKQTSPFDKNLEFLAEVVGMMRTMRSRSLNVVVRLDGRGELRSPQEVEVGMEKVIWSVFISFGM